jgi:hypothetical protein
MDEPMKDLAKQTFELLEMEEGKIALGEKEKHDYGFVVFPLAKSYEGFLKKVLLDMRMITKQQYNREYFRIGKVLNPNLPKRYRAGWVFGKLVNACGGEHLPLTLWEVWKKARNKIFHFFPDHQEFISLAEARELVTELMGGMEAAVMGCGVK